MSMTALLSRIEDKRDELVSLTRDLVKIPTTNPPGENYSDCARYIGERLAARGFEVSYLRAKGAVTFPTVLIFPQVSYDGLTMES